MIQTLIVKNFYQDSVKLMLLSRKLSLLEGIQRASAIMATPNNMGILKAADIYTAEAEQAKPDDIVVVVKGSSPLDCENALEAARREFSGESHTAVDYDGEEILPRSLSAAKDCMNDASMVLISVPGEYAYGLANQALDLGLSPMIFSDNVSLEEEISLKKKAEALGLFVMGPDCGTSVINGACIGFGNKVRRGSIGIVGASGTGIQEVMVLIHENGGGISHAIGTGGRDLHCEVGGISMLAGMDLLEKDGQTEVVVLISKPADKTVADTVLRKARTMSKPVVVCFVGKDEKTADESNLCFADTLEEAALAAIRLGAGAVWEKEEAVVSKLSVQRGFIRGLYTGGTLSYEALYLMKKQLDEIHSNIHMEGIAALKNSLHGEKNTIIDLGDDEFTKGRAHPMIDPGMRCDLILKEASAEDVQIIMLDFVLGYGCNGNPAGEMLPSIREALQQAAGQKKKIEILGHVCGTELDPQQRGKQEEMLRDAGVRTFSSNAEMVRAAIRSIA